MRLSRLLTLILVLLLAEPAFALRCGNRVISNGDPMIKVKKYCGDPDAVQQRTIVRAGLSRSRTWVDDPDAPPRDDELLIRDRSYIEVLVEHWTYNFGPNKLMRLIRFENGVVRDIEQLGYGFTE
jgi:hypothetical protein